MQNKGILISKALWEWNCSRGSRWATMDRLMYCLSIVFKEIPILCEPIFPICRCLLPICYFHENEFVGHVRVGVHVDVMFKSVCLLFPDTFWNFFAITPCSTNYLITNPQPPWWPSDFWVLLPASKCLEALVINDGNLLQTDYKGM